MVVLESNVEDVQCSLVRWLHSCHFRCQSKRPRAVYASEVQGKSLRTCLADEFGFVGEKQLEQTKSIFVAPGSKTMNNGLIMTVQTSWTNEKHNNAGL